VTLLEIKLLIAALALAGGWFGFHQFVKSEQAKGAATCEALHEKSDRAEEQRRLLAEKDIRDESQRMASRRQADASGLVIAGNGVRQRVSTAIGFDLSASAPRVGNPAPEATILCADLLEQASNRLQQLASTADASYDAGKACEAQYRSLSR
jgi:hypothetical protein